MKLTSLFLVMLLFSACGYTPSAKFSRVVVGNSISTSVVISAIDPENTVVIKDAVDAAIIEVFHASLTDKSLSKTHLDLSLGDPVYSPIQYDKDGFVVSYRTNITLSIIRTTDDVSKSYTAKGTYDFAIKPNAIISDQQRFDAIRESAKKAIKSFIAQISAEGARENKGQKKED